eukprot:2274407-Rhodomonas_salina.1
MDDSVMPFFVAYSAITSMILLNGPLPTLNRTPNETHVTTPKQILASVFAAHIAPGARFSGRNQPHSGPNCTAKVSVIL